MEFFCIATLQIEHEVGQTPEDVLSEEDELVGSFAVIALLKVDVLRRWRDHDRTWVVVCAGRQNHSCRV